MFALSDLTLTAIQAEATRAHLTHKTHSMLNPGMELWERLAILVEEIGEVATACTYDRADKKELEVELIQVAAMAASWVEALNHNQSERCINCDREVDACTCVM